MNTGERLPMVLEKHFPWCADEVEGIRSAFEAYTARKRERQLLDYDDLLLCCRALGAVPGLLAGLFDHVLVDEYQDTNALQADILSASAATRRPRRQRSATRSSPTVTTASPSTTRPCCSEPGITPTCSSSP